MRHFVEMMGGPQLNGRGMWLWGCVTLDCCEKIVPCLLIRIGI